MCFFAQFKFMTDILFKNEADRVNGKKELDHQAINNIKHL